MQCVISFRLLFRERQTQSSAVDSSQLLSQSKTTPTGVKTESSFVGCVSTEDHVTRGGGDSEQVRKTCTTEEEPMEPQAAADNEQPKSKPTAVPRSSQAKSSQSSISKPSQSGQTRSTGSTLGGARDEEEMPYFPAHPISYFPEDEGSSATVTAQAQQAGPFSIFGQQFSLYAISEDDPTMYVPTLENFQVSSTV